MKTVTRLGFVFIMIFILFSCSKQERYANHAGNLKDIWPIFKFWFTPHKPSTNCLEGWGVCNVHLIILGQNITKKSTADDPDTIVNGTGRVITIDSKYYLKCKFKGKEPYPDDTDFEAVEGTFSSEISQAAGYSSIDLIEGTYDFYTDGDSVAVNLAIIPHQ